MRSTRVPGKKGEMGYGYILECRCTYPRRVAGWRAKGGNRKRTVSFCPWTDVGTVNLRRQVEV